MEESGRPDIANLSIHVPQVISPPQGFITSGPPNVSSSIDLELNYHILSPMHSTEYDDTIQHPFSRGLNAMYPSLSADRTVTGYTASSTMDPPPRKRAKKAPTLHARDWTRHKERIIELHINQKLPLREVRDIMEHETRFAAKYVFNQCRFLLIDILLNDV